jgi:hypothetical protein
VSGERVEAAGGWVSIKVAAAFGGLRFLPWWLATGTNSANPALEIGPRGIRYRLLRQHEAEFDRIEQVDVRTAWRTVNLCFLFRDATGTFSANVRHAEEAARALRLLRGRAPLTGRAQRILAEAEKDGERTRHSGGRPPDKGPTRPA